MTVTDRDLSPHASLETKQQNKTQKGMRQMLSVKPDFLKGNRSDQGS